MRNLSDFAFLNRTPIGFDIQTERFKIITKRDDMPGIYEKH